MKQLRLYGSRPVDVDTAERAIRAVFPPSSLSQTPLITSEDQYEELERWNTEELAQYREVGFQQAINDAKPLDIDSPAVIPIGKKAERCTDHQLNASWLREKCERVVAQRKNYAMTGVEMAIAAMSLLKEEDRTDEELQEELFDVVAGDFETVLDVISRRKELLVISDAILADCSQVQELDMAGVDRHHGRKTPRIQGLGHMFSIVDAEHLEDEKRKKTLEKRARRAGLFASEEGSALQVSGTAVEELQKAFPGIQLDSTGLIGGPDRVSLPEGSTKSSGDGYEEIHVPPPRPSSRKLIPLINIHDAFAEYPEALKAFQGITVLNRLQSAVYPRAFKSNENLLVCAPTGAGKTNVALLTILREVEAVRRGRQSSFKIVYVAPMKALAAEVVEKFGERLGPIGIRVREYTGDMSLSRQEAIETHILVTTPEKWDVVTRKAGSELAASITLFIVDEVHLLHDDRGSVLESIVARTLRLSEAAQRVIRLVGLSATLPNYRDVATFMRVNPNRGLFHFDGGFRPVPLSQTFVGVTAGGSSMSTKAVKIRNAKMTQIAYEKVVDSLARGHQAMIFVHSRKETSSTARDILELAAKNGIENIFLEPEGGGFSPSEKESSHTLRKNSSEYDVGLLPTWASREISRARTKDVRDLCAKGIGIHNAGLPRVDRKLVEKLFAQGIIKLLCCTATLAWGVNLPARSVVIKGTEVYDSQKSAFVQLGMLDVTQIFGRAGRPQYDTFGEATIITAHEHLAHYLNMLTSATPIESTLSSSASVLADHLNAEIVSGTVTDIGSGVQWLSYTYLSVRMPLNPLAYGISWTDVYTDPNLHTRRSKLITSAAKLLDDAQMARYDPRSGSVTPRDLGRVASHYYVSHNTIVLWNELLSGFTALRQECDQYWVEIDSIIFHAVASASEFDQIRSREEEIEELDALAAQCPIPLRSPSSTREGKVAILLQAYISRLPIRIADLSYVTQSATRLLRALFEICLRMGIPSLTLSSLELARASESRVWPFQHPLYQVERGSHRWHSRSSLSREALRALDGVHEGVDLTTLRRSPVEKLIPIIGSRQHAAALMVAAKSLPFLEISSAESRPLSRTALEVDVVLAPGFTWKDSLHGKTQHFWMWIEDQTHERIYHSDQILLRKGQKRMQMVVSVPVFDPPSPSYTVRIESGSFHTCGGSSWTLSLDNVLLPRGTCRMTKLHLSLRPLPVASCLPRVVSERLSRAGHPTHFGPAETQCFHNVRYCLAENVLVLGAAEHAAFSMAEVAVLAAVYRARSSSNGIQREGDGRKRCQGIIFLKSTRYGIISARERLQSLGVVAHGSNKEVLVTTAVEWYSSIKSLAPASLAGMVGTVVVDEIHRIYEDPFLEVVLTRVRRAGGIRIAATGAVIAGVQELSDWLGVAAANLFVFDWASRSVPVVRHVMGAPGDRYAARMVTMNRMVYSAICSHGQNGSLIFVASKKQVRETVIGLRRLAAVDGNPQKFVRVPSLSREFDDWVLKEAVDSGIAFVHSGLTDRDARSITQLVLSFSVGVLIATADCVDWCCTSAAGLVVVKGTDMYDVNEGRYVEMNIGSLLSMVSRAGSCPGIQQGHAIVLTEEKRKTALKKFLFEPLNIESNVISLLPIVFMNEIAHGWVCSLQDAVDYFTWTYCFRRLLMNPSYYRMLKPEVTFERLCFHVSKVVENAFAQLVESGTVTFARNSESLFVCTPAGELAAQARVKPESVVAIRAMLRVKEASMEMLLDLVCSLDEFGRARDRPRSTIVERAIDKLVSDSVFRSREQAMIRLGIHENERKGNSFAILEILLSYLSKEGHREVRNSDSVTAVLLRARAIADLVKNLAKLESRRQWYDTVSLFADSLHTG